MCLHELIEMNKAYLKNAENQMSSLFQDIHKEIQDFSNIFTYSASLATPNSEAVTVIPTGPCLPVSQNHQHTFLLLPHSQHKKTQVPCHGPSTGCVFPSN